MLVQASATSGVVFLALAGLVASNLVHDRGVPSSQSRYIAPVLGGFAFLVGVLLMDMWIVIATSSVLTLLILTLSLRYRSGLRGVRGHLPTQAWSELTYALAGTASLVVGWALLGDRFLAFLPIAFMAWGDSVAGLARATIWRNNIASRRPSFIMLAICLGAAALFQPYWTGALGALTATLAERRRPMISPLWDDNLHLAAASLAVISLMTAVAG